MHSACFAACRACPLCELYHFSSFQVKTNTHILAFRSNLRPTILRSLSWCFNVTMHTEWWCIFIHVYYPRGSGLLCGDIRNRALICIIRRVPYVCSHETASSGMRSAISRLLRLLVCWKVWLNAQRKIVSSSRWYMMPRRCLNDLNWSDLCVQEVKDELKALGLDTSGLKAACVARLEDALREKEGAGPTSNGTATAQPSSAAIASTDAPQVSSQLPWIGR